MKSSWKSGRITPIFPPSLEGGEKEETFIIYKLPETLKMGQPFEVSDKRTDLSQAEIRDNLLWATFF